MRSACLCVVTLALATGAAAPAMAQSFGEVFRELNGHKSIAGSGDIKSYKILFDAYKAMTPPPRPIGPNFSLTTIHAKMAGWDEVANWAEANGPMADAILEGGKRQILGLPYVVRNDKMPAAEIQMMALIGEGDDFSYKSFPYLHAIQTMAAYSTAEIYRLMEAGQVEDALALNVAILKVLRQICDRQFVAELEVGYALLTQMLSNTRDIFYLYQSKISADQFQKLSYTEIPSLLLDRRRLELPEGDHIVAKALIDNVFDDRDQPDPEKFASTFGQIQAQEKPMTLFGAIRRWEQVAHVHASREASQQRLTKIYDDWWRRWGWRQYEIMHQEATEFDLANPIRYAAVRYSLRDLELLFSIRNQLFAAINGTAVAAGLCGYYQFFDSAYPTDQEKVYNQFVRKFISDQDPYDRGYGRFQYALVSQRTAVDTPAGRIWIDPGMGMLWARGEDHADNRGTPHSDNGAGGTDVLLWPPVSALSRQQGVIP